MLPMAFDYPAATAVKHDADVVDLFGSVVAPEACNDCMCLAAI